MMSLSRAHPGASILLSILLLLTFGVRSLAAEVPAQLPAPDGKAGDATKPVEVYILAGQSNMVGMGDIAGAKNIYTGVYLSSDPTVPEGPLSIHQVGTFKISRLAVRRPDGTPTDLAIAEGTLEVPVRGVYQVHCGSGERACTFELDGREVFRHSASSQPTKLDVNLEPGRRYPFRISGFEGTPPRFWLEQIQLLGRGDLEAVVKREGKFPWLVDDAGHWTVRKDVYFQEARIAKDGNGSLLSATSNGKSIGPELGFGHVLGTFHDEQVLLIKTAMGNRSLGFDFRPPSSGRTDPDSEWESLEYRLMVEGVRKTLDSIDRVVPGYRGQGYRIAGFAWFQGHKDSGAEASIAEYEQNLVHLIQDVRRDFDAPELPVVVATVGFGGHAMPEKFLRILDAQMAVGDPERHPEFAGTVASVDIRDFWREVDESPTNQDYHYNRNAETYLLIGDALGRAMVRLRGGQAAPTPRDPRPTRVTRDPSAELSESETAAARAALAPILLDGIARSYVASPRHHQALLDEVRGERPERETQFLRGALFGLVNCYRAAGIDEYDWHRFGPDLDLVAWSYLSFDPPETLAVEKGSRFRKVTVPAGMERWFAPDFDASAALDANGSGWKKGQQPFGQLDGALAPLSESCTSTFCRCGETPRTLWEREVLLVRTTIDVPPPKEGHRYRVVVGGSAHVNAGEGYTLFINGKRLAESRHGVAVRQGGQPRGALIYRDLLDELRGGKITLAAMSFLRYHHPRQGPIPPRGHLTLRLEEQKIPRLD